MAAKIVDRTESSVTIQVEIPIGRSMLQSEEGVLQGVNEVGRLATEEALGEFDTDGSPIEICGVRMTSKGRQSECYQTPYGEVRVERHVYQTSLGGKTFCPMERDARLLLNSTPRLAKMVSFKYSHLGANPVCRDFEQSHGRKISRGYVKDLSEAVAVIAEAKEETWSYALPELERPVESISLGLDGTCMLLVEGGWREAMVGTIAFFDREGERMHTIYMGASPEYGKERFRDRFSREIDRVQEAFPDSLYVGLADGSSENWNFLEGYVDREVLDFYHASEYVGDAAEAIYGNQERERKEWLSDRLSRLKHKQGAAKRLLSEMKESVEVVRGKSRRERLGNSIRYFENQHPKMNYAKQVEENLPIGSGVTEAACKILVKQRLCNSGMRWKERGASLVLSIRALVLTENRWDQFWNRIDRYGVPPSNN
jgi:hypothetical protein